MKTLAQLLIEYNMKHGYDVTIDELRDTLLYRMQTKWQGDSMEYRWRVDESRVVEIMDLTHHLAGLCKCFYYPSSSLWHLLLGHGLDIRMLLMDTKRITLSMLLKRCGRIIRIIRG